MSSWLLQFHPRRSATSSTCPKHGYLTCLLGLPWHAPSSTIFAGYLLNGGLNKTFWHVSGFRRLSALLSIWAVNWHLRAHSLTSTDSPSLGVPRLTKDLGDLFYCSFAQFVCVTSCRRFSLYWCHSWHCFCPFSLLSLGHSLRWPLIWFFFSSRFFYSEEANKKKRVIVLRTRRSLLKILHSK